MLAAASALLGETTSCLFRSQEAQALVLQVKLSHTIHMHFAEGRGVKFQTQMPLREGRCI